MPGGPNSRQMRERWGGGEDKGEGTIEFKIEFLPWRNAYPLQAFLISRVSILSLYCDLFTSCMFLLWLFLKCYSWFLNVKMVWHFFIMLSSYTAIILIELWDLKIYAFGGSLGGWDFSAVVHKLWNNLPSSLRSACTINELKSLLKTHLFVLASGFCDLFIKIHAMILENFG